MSEIVAIITEYNPFHNGHKYQIDKIREQVKDATIIAIMSGNCVQRGEFAFVNKYTRAKMAIECGVDAVFELPFPYACSTAEIFASAGVEIASRLGADYLYFGVEEDNLEKIEKIANILDTEEFNKEISNLTNKDFISYPKIREKALLKFGLEMSKKSNDILAIEYIRAIKNKKLDMQYRTIKRVGSGYKDSAISNTMSASAIREEFYKNGVILSLPSNVLEIIKNDVNSGQINDKYVTNKMLLSNVILKNPNDIENCFDVSSGMGYYIYESAKKCKNTFLFTDDFSSKSYTIARLKRAVVYSAFDIKSIDKTPKFTILLGANEKGKEIIKLNRKKENIVILTKHSDSKNLDEKDIMLYEKLLKLDELFEVMYMTPSTPLNAYKKIPYIK